jgi:hypothetical protein
MVPTSAAGIPVDLSDIQTIKPLAAWRAATCFAVQDNSTRFEAEAQVSVVSTFAHPGVLTLKP